MENNFIIPQSVLLKDTVRSFWQLHRLNHPGVSETIIPKGVVEMIFSFETPTLNARINNQTLTVPRCFVQGFHTCPVRMHLADRQTFFGVTLHPAAVKYMLNIPPVEFINCVTDLTLIDASFYTLWHNLGEQNFNGRVHIFINWLLKRLPQLTDREKALDHFLTLHTLIHPPVSGIAAQLCYSPRQLSRKLYELTGMNTEKALLYKKYLQSVHLMHVSDLSLTKIAYSCQFSDQSHFIKTFKWLTQLTPKAYRKRKSSIAGHIVEMSDTYNFMN
jgi:AraC-like DNA-binding protein